MPRTEEDGIALGSLFGALVGFVTAILVLDGILSVPVASLSEIPIEKSFTTFLTALGLKGGSEVAATSKLGLIKKSV